MIDQNDDFSLNLLSNIINYHTCAFHASTRRRSINSSFNQRASSVNNRTQPWLARYPGTVSLPCKAYPRKKCMQGRFLRRHYYHRHAWGRLSKIQSMSCLRTIRNEPVGVEQPPYTPGQRPIPDEIGPHINNSPCSS